MNLDDLKAYKLVKKENLSDIRSTGYLLRHIKTGARVMVIENDDENKVFNIAFRTPPKNSTGVAHILEHSVLCGSRDFPLKDPFVELVKGSLNTFLNAMTYPDKTCYPVASCNDQDFQNLMHVYLDAVFYPNIYKKEEIFRQEGWSYHLEKQEGPLTYNGVVYNEMKGAFSSPDDVLERDIMNSLFPDITYGCESGGDPDNIPTVIFTCMEIWIWQQNLILLIGIIFLRLTVCMWIRRSVNSSLLIKCKIWSWSIRLQRVRVKKIIRIWHTVL